MLKKLIVVCSTCCFIAACGTLSTIGRDHLAAPSEGLEGSQPCPRVPRIYSGVFYDYCVVFKGDGSDWELTGYLFWDLPGSLVLDTVVLPYSILSQILYGDIKQATRINVNPNPITPNP